MAWSVPTLDEIIRRIENDVETELSKAQGTSSQVVLLPVGITRILIRSFGLAVFSLYKFIAFLLAQRFAKDAEKEYLEKIGSEINRFRLPSRESSGVVIFTGNIGLVNTVVPGNTSLLHESGVEVITTSPATFSELLGSAIAAASARAVAPGSSGNIPAGGVLSMANPIQGVTSVMVNPGSDFVGGRDVESDDQYRTAVLHRKRYPSTGGNRNDLEEWAKEVHGVADAWCFPQTPSSGKATIAIRAAGSNPVPPSDILNEVLAHVSTKKTVTCDLFAVPVTVSQVRMNISTRPTSTQVRNRIIDNVKQVLVDESRPGSRHYVYPSASPNLTYPIQKDRIFAGIQRSGVDYYVVNSIEVNHGSGWAASPSSESSILMSGYAILTLNSIIWQAA